MTDPATSLAMTAATTIVAAMATAMWQATKAKVAHLFHRHGGAEQDIEVRLDRSASRVVEAAADPGATRDAQVTRWREDIEDLVHANPAAAADLRTLIAEIRQQLPQVEQRWIQHVEAHDGGLAVGAQGPGSSVVIHQHTPPHTGPDEGTS
ncbi:MAG TPA: hypothetical protein VHF06_10970 [Pseudonocardiaceae bacterium]|jgi:uncharacterized protein YdaU (DUF1376 family)|nr:hypothetical protein [Pseudonocardiaceae bacterium]